jgi:hypothetical protein
MSEGGKIRIPIKCKWRRESRSDSKISSSLDAIKSNLYQLSSNDLGFIIVVEVTTEEEDCEGTAIGRFGPVSLNLDCRKSLEKILAQGSEVFIVKIYDNSNPWNEQKDSKIKFVLEVSEAETNLFMEYEDGPRNCLGSTLTTTKTIATELHLKDFTRFVLYMNIAGTLIACYRRREEL